MFCSVKPFFFKFPNRGHDCASYSYFFFFAFKFPTRGHDCAACSYASTPVWAFTRKQECLKTWSVPLANLQAKTIQITYKIEKGRSPGGGLPLIYIYMIFYDHIAVESHSQLNIAPNSPSSWSPKLQSPDRRTTCPRQRKISGCRRPSRAMPSAKLLRLPKPTPATTSDDSLWLSVILFHGNDCDSKGFLKRSKSSCTGSKTR